MFLSILLSITLALNGGFSIEVTISQGTLSGFMTQSRNGTAYYAFLSIPYSKPPLGGLRFQPPQDPDPWEGVRNAKKEPPVCIQRDQYTSNSSEPPLVGEEDCLYLNVYTPMQKSTAQKLPVMVWIHGGGLSSGYSAVYQPDYIMDHGVVFVTLNYRLGILGFLSTGDSASPGNYGMKDQVAALRWVKKNIASFGGDPDNVTIFGQSAGGGSVSMHLYSPLSQGLFHKAISQSGTALDPWMHFPRRLAVSRANATAVVTGCYFPQNENIIECLRNVPAAELVDAYFKLFVWEHSPSMLFSVVTEPEGTEGAFLTKDPISGGELNPNIPWITGVTSAEGAFKVGKYLENDGKLMKKLSTNWDRLFPVVLWFGSTAEWELTLAVAASLYTYYFQTVNTSIEFNTRKELVDLFSDAYFLYGATKSVMGYRGRKYLYFFDYKAASSFNSIVSNSGVYLGVTHCDELQLLFKLNHLSQSINELNPSDEKMSELLIKMWVNFAYTGDPNVNNNSTWEPTQSNMEYLHISNDGMKMKKDFFGKEKLEFWNSLPLVEDPNQQPTS